MSADAMQCEAQTAAQERGASHSLCSDPFKKDIQGVVVESTYNWYWLVDALMGAGYRVHLANVSAIKQCEGLKQVDDRRSSLRLANLLKTEHPSHRLYLPERGKTNEGLSKKEAAARPPPDRPRIERQEHLRKEPRVALATKAISMAEKILQ